jgi:hypothetical protein
MEDGHVIIPSDLKGPVVSKGVSKSDLVKKLKKYHKLLKELPMPASEYDRPTDLDQFAESLADNAILNHKDKVCLISTESNSRSLSIPGREGLCGSFVHRHS